MSKQVQRFSPCSYQGGCTRGTNDPSHLCHKHRYLQKGYTRGGQLVFSSGGSLGAIPRLSKENTMPPPKGDDSMEIEGFPYFSVNDQKRYVDWKIGVGPRPTNADVIDRFPVEVTDSYGAEITGDEIGIYDTDGKFFSFKHDAEEPETEELVTGGQVRIFEMEDNSSFAIRANGVYQVVIFNRDKLGSHL